MPMPPASFSVPEIAHIFALMRGDMTPVPWWFVPLVLALLGGAAAVDARKGRVPDSIILPGLFIAIFLEGFYVSWPFAGWQFVVAAGCGGFLWVANEIWRKSFHHDAIGMGDAKWTVLAVAAFGIEPALFAWALGACLALLWMGMLRMAGRKISRVHFAPFLFAGLVTGLCWLRMP